MNLDALIVFLTILNTVGIIVFVSLLLKLCKLHGEAISEIYDELEAHTN